MKSKTTRKISRKNTKNYWKDQCKLLDGIILKLLNLISEEHHIPIQSLESLYYDYSNKHKKTP